MNTKNSREVEESRKKFGRFYTQINPPVQENEWGEKEAFGSDDIENFWIDVLHQELQKAREEERERTNRHIGKQLLSYYENNVDPKGELKDKWFVKLVKNLGDVLVMHNTDNYRCVCGKKIAYPYSNSVCSHYPHCQEQPDQSELDQPLSDDK